MVVISSRLVWVPITAQLFLYHTVIALNHSAKVPSLTFSSYWVNSPSFKGKWMITIRPNYRIKNGKLEKYKSIFDCRSWSIGVPSWSTGGHRTNLGQSSLSSRLDRLLDLSSDCAPCIFRSTTVSGYSRFQQPALEGSSTACTSRSKLKRKILADKSTLAIEFRVNMQQQPTERNYFRQCGSDTPPEEG